MTTHIELFMEDGVEGLLYLFDKAGEGLGGHTHDEKSAHDVQVMRGKVVIYGDMPAVVLGVGEPFSFDWRRHHEIIALEDGTLIFNRLLNGVPEVARNLSPEKRRMTVEDSLHTPIPYHLALR
jgi:hypothetical protein